MKLRAWLDARVSSREPVREGSGIGRMIRDEEGAMAAVVAILFAGGVLFGIAATVVDVGSIYSTRRHLQTAADAAALAGAQNLPTSTDAAQASADAYAHTNGGAAVTAVSSSFSNTYVTNDTIQVIVDGAAPLHFMRWFGREQTAVAAAATAVAGSPTRYGSGVMPFGIMAQSSGPAFGLPLASDFTLELGSGDASSGNYHMVDLTSYSPYSQLKRLIGEGGTSEPVSIGDIVPPQPGNPDVPNYNELNSYLGGCDHTFEDLVYDAARGLYVAPLDDDGVPCRRLITCPIIAVAGLSAPACYDWEELEGSSDDVQIVAFLNVFIEGEADPHEGTLSGKLVQVAPIDASGHSGYIDWAGVMWWLER